jgi:hypothetical protein
MKLQAKSLLSPRVSNARTAVSPDTPRTPAGFGPAANLQALATELHQSATQGLFEYPRNWVSIAKVAAVSFIAFAMLRLLLMVRQIMQAAASNVPLANAGVSIWDLAAVVLGAFLTVAFAAVLINLFPSIRVTPQGLGISELFGWRRIPWNQVGVLRVMELAQKDRYVLMIPFRGATRPPSPAPVLKLIPALAGALQKGERGLVVTSDIKNFDRMVQLMVSYLAQASGQNVPRVELFVDETAVMPFAQLVLEPEAAIVRMARSKAAVDVYGMPEDDVEPDVRWARVLPRQLMIALAPAALLLATAATRNGGASLAWAHLAWAGAITVFGVLELPFMAKLIQTVGDILVGSGQFKRTALAYLELQTPRVMFVLLGLVLFSIGLPPVSAQICWLAGIGMTTWLTSRFVQRLYYVPFTHTLIAGIGCFMFQVVLLALYFGVS